MGNICDILNVGVTDIKDFHALKRKHPRISSETGGSLMRKNMEVKPGEEKSGLDGDPVAEIIKDIGLEAGNLRTMLITKSLVVAV